MEKRYLHTLSEEELSAWLVEVGEPAFRAKQIREWLWSRCVEEPARMTNIGKKLQAALGQSFTVRPMELVSKLDAGDGETTKLLWRLSSSGEAIESVLIRAPGRKTICVSSQVGCPVHCTFCASGQKGFFRNLDAAEIVTQVLGVQRACSEKVSHVVFMGMGEPLLNYDAVVEAVRLLCDPRYLGLSRRRITISTVGIVENIRRLANEGVGVNLALSLHAPTQELRERIIPYARRYALEDILEAVELYRDSTGRDVTFEYILIAGVNDSAEEAKALAALVHKGCVNLIPYNPVSGVSWQRPTTRRIEAFRRSLEQEGVVHTCRYTKGADIAAACGQLALQEG